MANSGEVVRHGPVLLGLLFYDLRYGDNITLASSIPLTTTIIGRI